METQEITIRVTPEAANAFRSASTNRKEVLESFISAWLDRAGKPTRSFEELRHEASETARENGLTPEILQDILNER